MSSAMDGPRLVVTSDDHRAIIVITAVTCVLWSLMVIGARIIWRLHQKSDFGLDDTVALLGTLLSIAQAGLTLRGVGVGFGKKVVLLHQGQSTQAGQYLYAAGILYVLAMCASKASMPLLIARLTRDRRQIMWTYVLLGITVVWGVISVFGVAFACGVHVPWVGIASSTCSGLYPAWVTIEVIGLLIEVAYLAMSFALVQNLHMLLKFKLAVVGSFSLRMLLIIPVALRLYYLHQAGSSPDAFFTSTAVAVATQVVLHYSLWAASFPCMRAFLRAFDTGLGATMEVSTQRGSNFQSDSKNTSFAMKSINRDNAMSPTNTKTPARGPTASDASEKILINNTRESLKPEPERPYRGRRSDEGSESSGKPIISRTVEWKITYEDAPGAAV